MKRLIEKLDKQVADVTRQYTQWGCDNHVTNLVRDSIVSHLTHAAHTVKAHLRPRPLATEPPGKEDEQGEILVRDGDAPHLARWTQRSGYAGWILVHEDEHKPVCQTQYLQGLYPNATWQPIAGSE